MKILKKTFITNSEAKEILQTLKEEEADQLQRRTLEYVKKFSKVDPETAKKLKAKLVECGLKEEEAVEVVNIMPKSVEELRILASGWRRFLPTEKLTEILKILSG